MRNESDCAPQVMKSDVRMWLFLAGVFIARGKEDVLVTKNLVPGEVVYGEKKIVVEVGVVKLLVLVNCEL